MPDSSKWWRPAALAVGMSSPWASGAAPAGEEYADSSVTLLEGSSFCISESGGDVIPGRAQGLFVRDTRVLSRWELTIDGQTIAPLTVQHDEPFAGVFLGRPPAQPGLADSTLLVVRRRYVGNGMREDITLRNSAPHAVICVLVLAVDADFADLFEVKGGRVPAPQDAETEATGSRLRIRRSRNSHEHGVLVDGDEGAEAIADGLRWTVSVPARGQYSTCIEVIPLVGGTPLALRHPRGQPIEHTEPAHTLREWRDRSPTLETVDANLATVLRRSVEDLGVLRIFDPDHPDRAVIAAGAPWYMALFGRDSLLTSWMLLPLDASLAVGTLQTLADHQGAAEDPASEEEPGRILHEMRFGPTAALTLGGRSTYYGTADATSLFVMLLGELNRWGGHEAAVGALLPHADRALEWIERYGDADGDGFVEYARKTEHGLANQGWKDSFDGINYADGAIAQAPIALAEVQGYTYAAYLARGHLAQEAGDTAIATRCFDKARHLKRTFNERFWLPERGWFAVGLDRDKRPIDALTSNLGHCLWTGIVDEHKAEQVADHLLSDDMFTGWGIRTLAASMGAYNPVSYHNGSVWPHDNAICVGGLMRYGFVEHAQRVAEGILDAASHFGHRLPELFCGFSRADFTVPVPYPTSCSPQAWAAAAPLELLRALLRFEPQLRTRRIWCAPAVPRRYLPLRISNLRLGGHQLTVDARLDGWALTGLDGTGVELIRTPRPADTAPPGNP